MPLSAILYILFSTPFLSFFLSNILNSLLVLILSQKVESSLIDNFNLGDFIFDSTFCIIFISYICIHCIINIISSSNILINIRLYFI